MRANPKWHRAEHSSMLNVVGDSENFGADNDLKCEATQLGKSAAGQQFSQNRLPRMVDRQRSV